MRRSLPIAASLVLAGVLALREAEAQGPRTAGAGSLEARAVGDGSAVLYARADLLEAQTGQVELRRAYTRSLTLPVPHCTDAKPRGCSLGAAEEAVYGQVYELTYVAERLSRDHDTASTTRTDRGRLRIALDLPKKVEDAFEDALLEEIEGLSPAAFALPQAGMRYLEGALSQDLLRQSARPAWVCAGLDRTDNCDIVDGSNLSAYSSGSEMGKDAADALGRSVRNLDPVVVRTAPDVLVQQRTEIRFRTSSTLAGKTWSDTLARLPQEATFTKSALDGKKTGGMRDRRGEFFRGHEGRDGVTERDVLLPPASLDLLGVPMWVAEWRFTTTKETFGEVPTVERGPAVSFLLAVAPIVDPLMDARSRSGTALSTPANQIQDSVLSVFKHSARLGPDLIEEALYETGIWPSSGDWLIVGCAYDDTARYGIAPFVGVAKVTNAREACTAIRRELR